MNIHKNARLTPKGREVLISRLERGERGTMDGIAQEAGLSRATVGQVLARHGVNWWRDLEPV